MHLWAIIRPKDSDPPYKPTCNLPGCTPMTDISNVALQIMSDVKKRAKKQIAIAEELLIKAYRNMPDKHIKEAEKLLDDAKNKLVNVMQNTKDALVGNVNKLKARWEGFRAQKEAANDAKEASRRAQTAAGKAIESISKSLKKAFESLQKLQQLPEQLKEADQAVRAAKEEQQEEMDDRGVNDPPGGHHKRMSDKLTLENAKLEKLKVEAVGLPDLRYAIQAALKDARDQFEGNLKKMLTDL